MSTRKDPVSPVGNVSGLILWAALSIFNVFLPRFLEEKLGKTPGGDSRTESLQEYCIYTLAG